MSLQPQTPSPFSSKRLHFHGIRPTSDLPVFLAINADPHGFQNSNFTNNKLAGPADAEKYMKETAEDSLLGAVIWLPHGHGFAELNPPEKEAVIANLRARGMLADLVYGIAIGEVHLSALKPQQSHHRWTEIGIDILPPFQGLGYGGEAIQWALDYAFRRCGLHRVRIRGFEWNAGALRLYERLGFKLEGRERESLWHEGRWWDGLTLGMLSREWKALQEEVTMDAQ